MKKFQLLLLTLISGVLGLAQDQIGEWSSLTSLLSPTGITISSDGIVYAATEGGVLQFNPQTDTFKFITNEDGLDYLDISSIIIDDYDRLWLGGNSPEGTLQVYSESAGLSANIIHLGIDKIHKITLASLRAYAIYEDAQEWGLLEFQMDASGLPIFQDHFFNFPTLPDKISDVDVFQDSIYIIIQDGVLTAGLDDVLNFSGSWHYSYQNQDGFAQKVVGAENPYLINKNMIYAKDSSGNWDVGNPIVTRWFGQVLHAELLQNPERFAFVGVQYVNELPVTVYFEYDTMGNLLGELPVPTNSQYTCFDEKDGIVAFGLENHGIMILDTTDPEWNYEIHVPNTLMHNVFHAISLTDEGELMGMRNDPVGTSGRKFGGFIKNGDEILHIIPSSYAGYFPLEESDTNDFSAMILNYAISGKQTRSIIKTESGDIMFNNSGVYPSQPGVRGGLVEINPQTFEYTVYDTTDGILDGQAGVYYHGWTTRYLTINQINKDKRGNTWVVNPYSEQYNHIAAVQLADGSGWTHISAPDIVSYLPEEVAFDRNNRAWFGFLRFNTMNTPDTLYSSGGLKVFNHYYNLENTENHTWSSVIFNEEPPGESIYSQTFDEQDLLWILSNGGVQGYFVGQSVNSFTLTPIFPLNFFAYIPFTIGDKIRVDAQNNKWIITQHSGVRVIQENTTFWPDEEGFTQENSGLLSDIVYDIAFDNSSGLAYLSTAKGISIVRMPYQEPVSGDSPEISLTPNPFKIPEDGVVYISDFTAGSSIRIMTLSGKVIRRLEAENYGLQTTQVVWDGLDKDGRKVGSGVYLVSAYHETTGKTAGKLAVIRQ